MHCTANTSLAGTKKAAQSGSLFSFPMIGSFNLETELISPRMNTNGRESPIKTRPEGLFCRQLFCLEKIASAATPSASWKDVAYLPIQV
jgi:hypothetical protein